MLLCQTSLPSLEIFIKNSGRFPYPLKQLHAHRPLYIKTKLSESMIQHLPWEDNQDFYDRKKFKGKKTNTKWAENGD